MRAWTLRSPPPWLGIRWLIATSIVSVIVWFAACTDLNDLTAPECAYSVAPTTIDVGNQGGTGTLTIRAPGVCAWTVENSSGWVSLTGERSGAGDGSLAYAVAAHEGFDYRYATLTVAGKGVTVSQAGRPLPPPPPPPPPPVPVCSYAVSPATVASPATGGPGSIAVAAPAGCVWTASTQAVWLTITSGANGSGSGAFGFTVAANTAGAARSGSMSAGGQTIAVSQAGVSPPPPTCTYSVAPTSASFPTAGGTGTINVTAPAGCAWTASSQTGWVTITSGANGSGSGAFGFTVAANTTTAARTGSMSAGGQMIAVSQAGAPPPPNCSYSISPNSATFQRPGGSGTINVTAPAGCAWTAVPQQSWIRILTGSTGSGNGQVQYSVDACTCNNDRNGRIVVAGRNFDIKQEAKGDAPAFLGVLPIGR